MYCELNEIKKKHNNMNQNLNYFKIKRPEFTILDVYFIFLYSCISFLLCLLWKKARRKKQSANTVL